MRKIFTLFVIAVTLCLTSCSSDNNDNSSSVEQPKNNLSVRIAGSANYTQPSPAKIEWADGTQMPVSIPYSTHLTTLVNKIYFTAPNIEGYTLNVSLNGKSVQYPFTGLKKYIVTFQLNSEGVLQPNDAMTLQ